MSTLTKAFVILNLVFSIVFVAISATVLSQRTHWKDKYNNLYEKEYRPLQKSKRELQDTYDADIEVKNKEIEVKTREARDLQNAVDDQKATIKLKDDEIGALKRERTSAAARADRLQQTLDREAADRKTAQERFEAERTAHLKAREDKDNLATALLGVNGQLTTALQDGRELRVKADALAQKVDEYNRFRKAAIARFPHGVVEIDRIVVGEGTVVVPPSRIHASVRDVDMKIGLVVLNVGSDNKPPVKEGYEFLIYRDKVLLAVARVTTVDKSMCAAEIIQKPAGDRPVKVSDEAMTRP